MVETGGPCKGQNQGLKVPMFKARSSMTRVEHDQSARAFGHEGNLLNASSEIENEVFLGQTVPSLVEEFLEGGLSGFLSIITSKIQGE